MNMMIERAAAAIDRQQDEAKRFADSDGKLAFVMAVPEHAASAAILAALDPEDAELVDATARHLAREFGLREDHQDDASIDKYVVANWDLFAPAARDAISALREQCLSRTEADT